MQQEEIIFRYRDMEYNQNITVTGYFMSDSNQLTFH